MIKIIVEIKKELGKNLLSLIEHEAKFKIFSDPNDKKTLDTFNKKIDSCTSDSEKAYLKECKNKYFNNRFKEEIAMLAMDMYQKMQEKYVRCNLGISRENGTIKLYKLNSDNS